MKVRCEWKLKCRDCAGEFSAKFSRESIYIYIVPDSIEFHFRLFHVIVHSPASERFNPALLAKLTRRAAHDAIFFSITALPCRDFLLREYYYIEKVYIYIEGIYNMGRNNYRSREWSLRRVDLRII